ncbi:hypothetical protein [Helicobacter pylori]|uniref:hypothetical protein n=1 Tax=Helicobacter pylori TaxID=210 RepID=UPI00115AD497|nr:hypothetical protein [Helicobacter pylori]QDK10603.1 hypothetical protein D8X81_00335 [Helicobacter pylori]
MKTIRNGLMIGAIGTLLLSGCSSYKSQGLACVDDKAMKKEAHHIERQTTTGMPSGLFDPYSSNLNHWDTSL